MIYFADDDNAYAVELFDEVRGQIFAIQLIGTVFSLYLGEREEGMLDILLVLVTVDALGQDCRGLAGRLGWRR